MTNVKIFIYRIINRNPSIDIYNILKTYCKNNNNYRIYFIKAALRLGR